MVTGLSTSTAVVSGKVNARGRRRDVLGGVRPQHVLRTAHADGNRAGRLGRDQRVVPALGAAAGRPLPLPGRRLQRGRDDGRTRRVVCDPAAAAVAERQGRPVHDRRHRRPRHAPRDARPGRDLRSRRERRDPRLWWERHHLRRCGRTMSSTAARATTRLRRRRQRSPDRRTGNDQLTGGLGSRSAPRRAGPGHADHPSAAARTSPTEVPAPIVAGSIAAGTSGSRSSGSSRSLSRAAAP